MNRTPRTVLTDPAGLFDALRALELPTDDYVVCGSAVLYVRGLRSRMGDLDVVARGRAWDIALHLAPAAPALSGHGFVVRHPDVDMEILDRWTPGWSTTRLIEDADRIDGIPFMRLGDILAWKTSAARSKDLPDLEAIARLRDTWNQDSPSPVHALTISH